ncbi:MAG: DUF1016 N-terminal domain-containing protein [Lachnospiraceae bacterium]|nr:DUF1016 N-terminal domain-containing protein [Lachnospiraceae bacterium]
MRISNEDERKFYTEEAAKAGWSSRQLNRQINTMYYQRILSSRDKASVAAEIELLESKQGFTKNFFVV